MTLSELINAFLKERLSIFGEKAVSMTQGALGLIHHHTLHENLAR